MLAIIPARGGSKGLPGKNIRPFLGKPLIGYTIEAARQSQEITEIVVSTESKEIADVAESFGIKIPFMRPAELATDESLAIDAFIYTIDRLSRETGKVIDEFIVLQPTSPLRTSIHIDESIRLFREKNADCVVSYTEEAHPIRWHKYINDDLTFENIFEDVVANRQEHRKSYYPNGATFVYKTSLIRSRKLYSPESYAYLMPNELSVDIDTLKDFEYAEFLMSRSESKK